MSEEKHLPLQRSLTILRHLNQGPADRDTLAEFVHIECDPTAYDDFQSRPGEKMFENDIKRLRELGTEIDFYDGAYHLVNYAGFAPVALSEANLDTLAFLAETFGPDSPNGAAVQALLGHVAGWLPENQSDSLPARRQRMRVDLRSRDDDQIDPAVQATIDRAIQARRLLRFDYRSPGQSDGIARTHTVQPWSVYFDLTRRHLYLDAYCLSVDGPYGFHRQELWRAYRLGRILAEGISILPDKLPPVPPKRPRHALEYHLAPQIARHGEITGHFDNMEVHETSADGWVRVTATTHDLFAAVRLLLTYGPYCRVTGGAEARREMERLVQGLIDIYVTR